MKIECENCGNFFQWITNNEVWVNYQPNTNDVECPVCHDTIQVKTYPEYPI